MSGVCVVLVEPQGALNVGSACRSMMNFGISDLRLVNPCEGYNGLNARRMALKASTILDQATTYSRLSQAVGNCNLIFGTTRRLSKYRSRSIFLSPEQAAQEVSTLMGTTQRVAYVFGREDKGLLNSELDICNFCVTIPTDKSYASINLSHAVNICMYELQKEYCENSTNIEEMTPLARSKEIEHMYEHMKSTLLGIGYLNSDNPDHIMGTFRKILGRAGLNDREVRVLRGLWSRIDWIESKRLKSM